eukprot:gene2377-19199_t
MPTVRPLHTGNYSGKRWQAAVRSAQGQATSLGEVRDRRRENAGKGGRHWQQQQQQQEKCEDRLTKAGHGNSRGHRKRHQPQQQRDSARHEHPRAEISSAAAASTLPPPRATSASSSGKMRYSARDMAAPAAYSARDMAAPAASAAMHSTDGDEGTNDTEVGGARRDLAEGGDGGGVQEFVDEYGGYDEWGDAEVAAALYDHVADDGRDHDYDSAQPPTPIRRRAKDIGRRRASGSGSKHESGSGSGKEAEKEFRVDRKDGKVKSKSVFMEEYDGFQEWDAALRLNGQEADANEGLSAEIDKLRHFITVNINGTSLLSLQAVPSSRGGVEDEEGKEEEDVAETRLDRIDGRRYTMTAFEQTYGGFEEWDAAAEPAAEHGSSSRAVEDGHADEEEAVEEAAATISVPENAKLTISIDSAADAVVLDAFSALDELKQMGQLGRRIKFAFQDAEVKLMAGSQQASPEELLAFVQCVSEFVQDFGIGSHYFEPNVLRDSDTDDADFEHAMAYIDFLRRLQRTVSRTMGVLSETLERGAIINVERMDHRDLRTLLVAFGHAKGQSSVITDAAITKTLEHGHLPLVEGADMLWALGVGGEVNVARQLFTAAGPLACRYVDDDEEDVAATAPGSTDSNADRDNADAGDVDVDGPSAEPRTCTCLAKILWSCSALGLQKQSRPFLNALALLSEDQLDSFNIHQIADVAWACTKLRAASGDKAAIRPVLQYFAKRLTDVEGDNVLELPSVETRQWTRSSCVDILYVDKQRQSLSHALASLSLLGVTFEAGTFKKLLKACGRYRPEPSPLRGESLAPMFDPSRARDMNMGAELAFHTKASGANSAIAGRVREQDKSEFESYAIQAALDKELGTVNEWPEAGAAKKAKLFQDQQLAEEQEEREHQFNGTHQLHLVVQAAELMERMNFLNRRDEKVTRVKKAMNKLAHEALKLIDAARADPAAVAALQANAGNKDDFEFPEPKSREAITQDMQERVFDDLQDLIESETATHVVEQDDDGDAEDAADADRLQILQISQDHLDHIKSQAHFGGVGIGEFEHTEMRHLIQNQNSSHRYDQVSRTGGGKRFAGVKPATGTLRKRALRLGLLFNDPIRKADYRSLKRPELVSLCDHYNLSKQGTVKDLVARLDKFAMDLRGSVHLEGTRFRRSENEEEEEGNGKERYALPENVGSSSPEHDYVGADGEGSHFGLDGEGSHFGLSGSIGKASVAADEVTNDAEEDASVAKSPF